MTKLVLLVSGIAFVWWAYGALTRGTAVILLWIGDVRCYDPTITKSWWKP